MLNQKFFLLAKNYLTILFTIIILATIVGCSDDDDSDDADVELSAAETAEAKKRQNRKHVWVIDGEFLSAIEIVTGLSDTKYTELVSGALEAGQKLVTGLKTK